MPRTVFHGHCLAFHCLSMEFHCLFMDTKCSTRRPSSAKSGSQRPHCATSRSTTGTPQQLALHRFKAHGAKHAIRTYVNTTFCVVCLREFWCRDRLLNHLRYRSKTCYNNIVLRGPVLSIAEADIFDAAEHVKNAKLSKMGKRSHFASITSVRLIGPLQPIILPEPNRESAHHPLGRGHNVH